MGRRSQISRYLTALGVAYLLVFQLLLLGVSAGSRITLANAPHDAILCLGTTSDDGGDGADGHDLPPCCDISCPMVGWAGLPPLPPSDALPITFVDVVRSIPPIVNGAVSQHDAAPFHARGPPAFL